MESRHEVVDASPLCGTLGICPPMAAARPSQPGGNGRTSRRADSGGNSPELGEVPGPVGWFDPPEWDCNLLRDDLFNPRSVDITGFGGNGWPDIYVAEMGLGKRGDEARHFVLRNRGHGEFEETVIERGVHTHEAKAVDVDGDGRVDVVGKSYEPNVDAWYNETE